MPSTAPELPIWTIYHRAADRDAEYTVRLWGIEAGVAVPHQAFDAQSLDDARRGIPGGLHRIPRSDADDPAIVESWI